MTRDEWEKARSDLYIALTTRPHEDALKVLDEQLPESLITAEPVAPQPIGKGGRPRKRCKHPASMRIPIVKKLYGHKYKTSTCKGCRAEASRRARRRKKAAAA